MSSNSARRPVKGTIMEPISASGAHGSGFGSALALRIMEEQPGKIALCSSSGKGTDVRIKMPYNITAAG